MASLTHHQLQLSEMASSIRPSRPLDRYNQDLSGKYTKQPNTISAKPVLEPQYSTMTSEYMLDEPYDPCRFLVPKNVSSGTIRFNDTAGKEQQVWPVDAPQGGACRLGQLPLDSQQPWRRLRYT